MDSLATMVLPLIYYDLFQGMTQAMITAARLIAHKSINGRYQTLMQMDQMDVLGQYVDLFSSSLGYCLPPDIPAPYHGVSLPI